MINICEVGPRDGLQNEKKFITTEKKVEMINRCIATGMKKIEAVSFVNPRVVPQMADAEEVLKLVPFDNEIEYAGLVLSQSGLERALQTKIHTIHVVLATSDTFNQKNAKRSVKQSVKELSMVIRTAKQSGKRVVGVLGTAFGCPFEGTISEDHVLSIADEFLTNGCDALTLADTTGLANPTKVRKTVEYFYRKLGNNIDLGLHFHNTRGLGLANVYAGYLSGVSQFDSSIAGLGGCPFAPKAVGNVCTEDMVNMFHEMGVETGVNLDALIESAKWIEGKIGRPLDGMMMKVKS